MRFGHGLGRDDDAPRRHHSEFTHVVLRAITFQLGHRFFDLARDGQLTEGLRGAWERTAGDLPEAERLPATGLAALHRERGSLEAGVVLLPQPMRSGEAYLVCGVREPDPFLGPGDSEFFLLEADIPRRSSDPGRRTRLAGWTRDGRQFDLGAGPLPEVNALLDAIARFKALGS